MLKLPPEALEQLKALIDSYQRLRSDNVGESIVLQPILSPPVRPIGPVTANAHAGTDAEMRSLKQKLAQDNVTIWWTDLLQAELCLLEVLDEQSLRTRVFGWRRRLHEVIGDQRFAQYSLNAPDMSTFSGDSKAVAVIRADLSECIRGVYYFYSAYGVAATSRSDVTILTFIVALRILAIQGLIAIVFALHIDLFGWSPPTIPHQVQYGLEYLIATSAAAVLGSVISVQSRLQNPAVDVDPFYRYVQTTSDKVSISYVSPIFASIFGVAIFALMASGLTGGNAFPRIDNLIAETSSVSKTLTSPADTASASKTPAPSQLADIALLLLYGLAAGFAERLVPDTLTRLAEHALASISGGTSAQVPSQVSPVLSPPLPKRP